MISSALVGENQRTHNLAEMRSYYDFPYSCLVRCVRQTQTKPEAIASLRYFASRLKRRVLSRSKPVVTTRQLYLMELEISGMFSALNRGKSPRR